MNWTHAFLSLRPATVGKLRIVLPALALLSACERPFAPSEPSASYPLTTAATVVDGTPRTHRTADELLSYLNGPARTDGTLIIGLKEPRAARGVAVSGTTLPITARLAAEEALKAAFPDLRIQQGVQLIIPRMLAVGTAADTIYRTAVLAAGPITRELLVKLRSNPYVDYLVPNFIGRVAASAPSAVSASMMLAGPDGSCGSGPTEVWS